MAITLHYRERKILIVLLHQSRSTESPKINRKSVLHLRKYTTNLYYMHMQYRFAVNFGTLCRIYIGIIAYYTLICTIVRTKRSNSNDIVTKAELPRGNQKLHGYSILISFSIGSTLEFNPKIISSLI